MINLQNSKSNFVIFLLIIIFLSTVLTGTASADTIVSISPQKQFIEDNQSFAVNIYIEPDTSVSGAQFDFTFNSTLVNVKDVQEKNALSQTGTTTMFSAGSIDNSQGTVAGVYSLILGKDLVTKPGTLATINLVSTGRSGVCKLQLSNVIVSNSSGNSMPVTVVDGSVYAGTAESTDQSIFFESETPGFSPFAITGQSSQFASRPENQVPDSKESLASGPVFEENSDGALSSEKETETAQDEDTKEDLNYQAPASGIYGTGILFLVALLFFKRNRE